MPELGASVAQERYPPQTLPFRLPLLAPLVAAVLLGGACGRRVYLGNLGDGGGAGILWQATFEPGDLSEWRVDGNGFGGGKLEARPEEAGVTSRFGTIQLPDAATHRE